jgi:uncharacterized repeat protein (TIGR01451 family)
MNNFDYTWPSSVAACNGASAVNGVRMFLNVVFTVLGTQSIVAADTTDGSVTGVGVTLVVGTDVKLTKEPRLMVAASGDTVQFRVCWSNYSSGSAIMFVINDALPVGTSFLPEASQAALSCGSTNGVGLSVAYSTATTPAVPPAASFTTGNPIAGTRWLRWTVPDTGVNTTGCACYRLTVN